MAKKKAPSEEIQIDEDLDFTFDSEIPDFDEPNLNSKSRTPVQKLSKGFTTGLKSALTDHENIQQSLARALPRGYGQAFTVADQANKTATELYHSVAKDFKPLTDNLRKASAKLSPQIKAKLPKALQAKLEAFSQGGDSYGTFNASKFKRENEDSIVTAALADLFQAQEARQIDVSVNDKAEGVVRDAIDQKRYRDSMAQGDVIATGISQLVGFQDQVLSRFQRKTLELQYRQYFVAKDLLDVTNIQQQKIISALGLVVTNTALPEAVKIQKSEMALHMLKERAVTGLLQNASNYTRNFRENLKNNVKGVVKGFSSGLGGAAGAAGAGGDIDAADVGGNAAGSKLGQRIHEIVSTMLAPRTDQITPVARLGAKVGNFIDSGPARINRWAQSETEGIGWKADLTNAFKAIPPQFRLNDNIQSNNVMDADRAANFDNLTRRSITEIIPGWLQQINRWTKAVATGKIDSDKEMDVYNLEKGRFTSSSDYLKDIKKRVSPKNANDSMGTSLEEFVAELDTENKLTPEQRTALKKKLLGDAAKGRGFDEETIANRKYYDGLAEADIDPIRDFLKDSFNIDFDGKMDQDRESLDKYNKHYKKFSSIASTLPGTSENVRSYHSTFGAANMDRLGFSARDGARDKIQYENIWNELAGVSPMEDAGIDSYGGDVFSPKGGRGGRGGKGADNKGLIEVGNKQLVVQTDILKFLTTTFTGKKDAPRPAERADAQVNGCDPCKSNEEYLGKDSLLLAALYGIRDDIKANNVTELMARQTSAAVESQDILDDIDIRISRMGQGMPGQPSGGGGAQRSPGGMVYTGAASPVSPGAKKKKRRGVFGLAKSAVTGYAKLSWEGYKLAGGAAWWGAKKAGGIAAGIGGWAGKKAFEKARVKGVYLKGDPKDAKPKLTQEGIDNEEYLDAQTGKPIKSFKDITGEVVDSKGDTVLTKEQFEEGIVNDKGTTLRGNILGGIKSTALFAAGAAWAPYKYGFKAIWGTAKFVFNAARDCMDLYLKGESIARLKKNLMKEGKYYDALTRKRIWKVSDIKGAVVDENGDEVVSVEEIAKSQGFWTATGKAVKTVGGTALNIALGAAKLYGQAVMLPFKAAHWIGKKVFKGIGKMFGRKKKGAGGGAAQFDDQDLVNIGWHQLSIQDEMFKFLKKTFGKKKGKSNDSDGDGDRDGSWRDIMANRKAKKDAATAAAAAAAGGGKKGPEGKAVPGEEGVSATEAGLLGAAGATALGMAKSGISSAASWVGKKLGGQALRQGLATAGNFVGRQVLWRGLQVAGTALGAVLGAPVVLGALAVGAVGYGAYKLWKHIADKPEPLVGMRLAQYGVDPREADEISPVLQLEELFIKNTSYDSDGKAVVGKGDITPEAILTIFKIDPASESNEERIQIFTKWVATRFMPVYVAHATMLNKLSKGTLLANIDKDMPIQQHLDFIKTARLDELSEVYDDTDTSPFEDELDSDADTVIKWVEDAINIAKVKLSALPPEPEKKLNDTVKAEVAAVAVATGAVAAASGDTTNGASKLKSSGFLDTVSTAAMDVGAGLLATLVPVVWFGAKIVSYVSADKKRPKVTLDALTAGRYKVYGLVELDLDKVEAIYNLEDAMFNDVTYDENKQAVYGGTAEKIYPLAKTYFGVTEDIENVADRSSWFAWYRYRFLPTFLQYCTSIRAKQAIDARDAVKKLTLDEQHRTLVETSGALSEYGGSSVSVWLVDVSPWQGYVLNKDEKSIAGNIEALKTAGKRANYKEASAAIVDPKAEIAMAKQQEAMDNDGGSIAAGADNSDDRGLFSTAMDKVFGGKAPDGQRTGGWFGSEGSNEKVYDANAKNLGGGAVIQKHPGGGTGGDINAIPAPTGAGWAASKDTLVAAANMVGFDAATAATVVAVESGFDPGIKAPTSSAGGYFQFIDSTWDATLKAHGAKYGLSPNASKYDGRANALMGMEFLKENQASLETAVKDRPISDTDLYAAHFLGPGGARRFLKAAPGSDARQAVGENVPGANHNIFYDKSNRARTVSGVYEKFNELLVSKRKMHDLVPGQKVEPAKIDEAGNTVGNAPGAETPPVVSTDGSAPSGEMVGPSPEMVGPTAPATAGAEMVGPTAPPVVAMGTASAALVSESKPPEVTGVQPTAGTSLTSSSQPLPSETAMPPAAQAAIAQTQSSTESSAINTSVSSLKDIMTEQLRVQMGMDGKLGVIADLLRNQRTASPSSTTVAANTPQPPAPTAGPTPSGSLPQAPVNVSRTKAG